MDVISGEDIVDNAFIIICAVLFVMINVNYFIICGGKKKKKKRKNKKGKKKEKKRKKTGKKGDESGNGSERSEPKDTPLPPQGPSPNKPKRPMGGGIASTNDPNYQTLAGIGQDIFLDGNKAGGAHNVPGPGPGRALGHGPGPEPGPKPAGPHPPGGGVVVAATLDPNYQTLAAIGGDVFGADKKWSHSPAAPQHDSADKGPKAPGDQPRGAQAATFDPNYQTLAGIGGDIFGLDKKAGACADKDKEHGGGGGGGVKAPQNVQGKAATFDPNYQTLAGIGGDIFGTDKKAGADGDKDKEHGGGGGRGGGGGVKAPQNPQGKAATFDPNYQTLAGIAGDIFGTDKKKKDSDDWL